MDLFLNKIGATGATALSKALGVNSTITSLNIGGNNIEDEGATELAEALKVNKSITTLDLRDNNIGPEGAIALAEALTVNSSITSLDLDNNKIGATGATEWAKALEVLSKNLNASIEQNKAISELSHIFIQSAQTKLYVNIEDILQPELIYYIHNYDEHIKDNEYVKIPIERKNQQKREIIQQKKKVVNNIYKSFIEYLEIDLESLKKIKTYDIEKTKEIFMPRKLLLQFLQNGDMFFTFKNRDLKSKVIKKLERIVIFEYINVLDELKEREEQQSTQQQTNMDIQSYQHYEKILFDTYRDQILKRFVEINNKKIENLQKEMQVKTQIQTQMQIKKQIEKKQEQLLKLRQKLKEKQSKRDQNKLIEYKQQKKQLIEIKNLVKINETVKLMSKMNKIEENILFYMLPDTVIFKYFDERNLGKAKDRKRKSYQLVESTQQQRPSSKKIKSNKTYRIISHSSNGDVLIQYINSNGSLKTDYLTQAGIQQLQKKGYREV